MFISGNQQPPLQNTPDDLCWWYFIVLHNTHVVHGCAIPGGHNNEVITTHMFVRADAAIRQSHLHILSWLSALPWEELWLFTNKVSSNDKSSFKMFLHRCWLLIHNAVIIIHHILSHKIYNNTTNHTFHYSYMLVWKTFVEVEQALPSVWIDLMKTLTKPDERAATLSDARQNPRTYCFLCKPTCIRRLELTCINSLAKALPRLEYLS